MSVKINYQNEYGVQEITINNKADFNTALKSLVNKQKLFLVMPGEKNHEFFITPYIDDIIVYLEEINQDILVFIQEFESGDYKEVIAYLSCLLELNEPVNFITKN